mmetsp:Transcript_74697/g.173030  ORF Transcript_74697/g.173030 Transcript_74697/m.173030 type:complete len:236 (-) Transcript_74697:539-1246(-)
MLMVTHCMAGSARKSHSSCSRGKLHSELSAKLCLIGPRRSPPTTKEISTGASALGGACLQINSSLPHPLAFLKLWPPLLSLSFDAVICTRKGTRTPPISAKKGLETMVLSLSRNLASGTDQEKARAPVSGAACPIALSASSATSVPWSLSAVARESSGSGCCSTGARGTPTGVPSAIPLEGPCSSPSGFHHLQDTYAGSPARCVDSSSAGAVMPSLPRPLVRGAPFGHCWTGPGH